MPESTHSSITISAPPPAVMAAIADFESYPQWTRAVKETRVSKRAPDGRPAEVWFNLDAGAIKDQYTLAYTWEADREVRWKLVESKHIVKSLDGAYVLRANDDGTTTATYQLAVEVVVPLLGMMKRRAEKLIIDAALRELKTHVER